MANVLVIDDDEMLCDMVYHRVQSMDHEAAYAPIWKKACGDSRLVGLSW
ncbi:MAG: hypothetical protein ACYS0H_20945 [Planctomycetota bacterium]|jgi:hypothetical protein